MSHHAVILGGGYAGIMAAQRLAAAGANVTLINNRAIFVERIRLHQVAAGEKRIEHSLPAMLQHKNVEFVQGYVTALDLDAQDVIYTNDSGEHTLNYDSLVYTLGSKTGDPPASPLNPLSQERGDLETTSGSPPLSWERGLGGEASIYTLDPGKSDELAARLGTLPNDARVVIVGGGLTGIEAASEFAESYPHLQVVLVTRGAFGGKLSQKGRNHLYKVFNRLNVQICDHLNVDSVNDGELITEQGAIPFEVCVWTAGFTVPTLAREAGLAVNYCGQIVVDHMLRSVSHPNVYAAGDSAFVADFPIPIRMSCNTAMPMGGHVGDNIAAKMGGTPEKPLEFRYFAQCISLGRSDALVQMVNRDDSPREQIITGKGGAVFKEMLCRMTINVLRLERHMPGMYRIPA